MIKPMKRTSILFGIILILLLNILIIPARIVRAGVLTNLKEAHPRLILTDDKVKDIKTKIKSDSDVKQWYEEIKNKGNALISKPYKELPAKDGLGLAGIGQNFYKHIETLGFLYRLEEDKVLKTQYAERVYEEISIIAAKDFPAWDKEQILDLGDFSRGIAYAYDWLYDIWTKEQKSFIKEAIVERSLKVGMKEYTKSSPNMKLWWELDGYWGPDISGGLGTAALAVGDEEEGLATEVIYGTIVTLPDQIDDLAPDGGYAAGMQYWDRHIGTLTKYIAALETAVGTDFGFSMATGYSDAGNFPLYMESNAKKVFNFAHSDVELKEYPQLFYLANKFKRAEYSGKQYELIQRRGEATPFDIIWYDPKNRKTVTELGFQKDKYFGLAQNGMDLLTLRSDWENEYGITTLLKGGSNNFTQYGQLDLGSFFIDALGYRWVEDLGYEDQSKPGIFDIGPAGDRWKYYKNRAESNNTLVINPGNKLFYRSVYMPGFDFRGRTGREDQDLRAKTKITNLKTNLGDAFGIMDLTEAYEEFGAVDVKRGLKLFDHRRKILLQDEIKLDEKGEVWWFMNTAAKIDLSVDGRSAMLTQGDKRMSIRLLDTQNAVLKVMKSEMLPTTVKYLNAKDEQAKVEGNINKLAIHFENQKDVKLGVLFEPLRLGEILDNKLPELQSLSKWNILEEDYTLLDGILLDGKPIKDFKADNFTYDIKLKEGQSIPVVSAEIGGKSDFVVINQAEAAPGVAVIEVGTPFNDESRARYLVYFSKDKAGALKYSIPIMDDKYNESYMIKVSELKKLHIEVFTILSISLTLVVFLYLNSVYKTKK
jgi:hypothetical protein